MTTSAVLDARTAAEQFLRDSQCGKPKCKCAISARRGHGLTHCPVHTDNSPSFNVTVKGDRLLVCCEAGCQQKDVVETLKDAGVWPQKAEYGKQIIAEYDYRDADGTLLYQALRYFPKDFKQRRPAGTDWTWSLGEVKRVPYRLPDLLASTPRIVFIPEGEKDVDRLYSLGFVATCNVGGAGKWRDEYSEFLRGRPVVLLPDNDETGRQHSQSVAASLDGIAQSVKWLELPGLSDKGDVSDWLDDGGTPELLRELVGTADGVPKPKPRERVFRREGLGYRFEPAGVPLVMRFSRLADRRDETTAELAVSRAQGGGHILRRRLNLLAATGSTLKGISEDLASEELGIDVDWPRVLRDGFESVLDAHRNGVVVESIKGEVQKSAPPSWLCDGLVLKNKVNCWLGAAGTGKSTLAKALCVYYAAGYQFLGHQTEMGVPLYIDWEDDAEDLRRVAHDVCRNLGVWPVPEVLWMNMRGKRLRDHIELLATVVDQRKVGLIVLDAIAAAGGSPGEYMGWEAVALEIEQCLGMLPPVTVLGLDHVTSAEHKDGSSVVPMKARGAERKVEFFRNQWTLVLDRDEMERGHHVVSWHNTKVNLVVMRPPFVTEIVHRDGELSINKKGIDASPAAVSRLPWIKQYVMYVAANPGHTTEHICMAVRGRSTKNDIESVRVELKRAADRGEARQDSGLWYPGGYVSAPNALPFDRQTLSDAESNI